MKNLFFTIVIAIFSLTSCQITEKIYLEENGSGKYDIEIDMNEMMKSMNGLGGETKIDSNYVATDSIINFSEMLIKHKDSISKLPIKQQEKLNRMKDIVMVIHEDKNKNEFSMNIKGAFNNIKELDELEEILNATQTDDKKITSKSEVKYSFKRSKFSRKAIERKLNEEETKKYDKSMESLNMFLSGSTYNLEYHFYKPIKSASIKNAKYSTDRKTIYIKKPVDDLINNPTSFDLDIKIEK